MVKAAPVHEVHPIDRTTSLLFFVVKQKHSFLFQSSSEHIQKVGADCRFLLCTEREGMGRTIKVLA
jgi:hypothetical protein